MIYIKNRVRKIKLDEKKIKQDVKTILQKIDCVSFDLGILFTTNTSIRKMNLAYRNKDRATDILSFPYHQYSNPGKRINVKTDDDQNLGDIVISLERAKRDSTEQNIQFSKYLRILLVHGICHLVGYTHDTDNNHKKMQRKETELLKLV